MTASQALHQQYYQIATRFALRESTRAAVAGKMANVWYRRQNVQLGMLWDARAAAHSRSADRFLDLALDESRMASARTLAERYGC